MSLIKFNNRLPWFGSEMSNFFDTDDFFNENFWNRRIVSQPALNIKETDECFEIELAAPGLEKKDFKVSVDDGYLNISAERTSEKEEKEDDFTRREFNYNSFKRSLLLPETVMQEDIKATYQDGLLKLSLNKKEEAKVHTSKEIEIS
ncbi:Hsp20/alpha crystallin family protein [Sungkyunkwania multivorans]|uniref:Hsp20/alpha crystallin family protein n=1 Tax=Sungkyunkwania multivorans TaxID=1173618 RepID=A0ABW3D1S6_9FLAO